MWRMEVFRWYEQSIINLLFCYEKWYDPEIF